MLDSESETIRTHIASLEKVSAIKFKSILKGSKQSVPHFMASSENHLSGYTLIPYQSETSNVFWCKQTKTFKNISIKGFICSMDSTVITKYKKARQTQNSFITNLSMFDGEAILDPEKFEELKKEMLKGHNTYSNHIYCILRINSVRL